MSPHPEIVYFIRARGDASALVKIGRTVNLPLRLDAFACGNPVPLEVLAVGRSSLHGERAVHKRFAALRSGREWFRPDAQLLSYIADLAADMPEDVALAPLIVFIKAYNAGEPVRGLSEASRWQHLPVTAGAAAPLCSPRHVELFMARVRRSALRGGNALAR